MPSDVTFYSAAVSFCCCWISHWSYFQLKRLPIPLCFSQHSRRVHFADGISVVWIRQTQQVNNRSTPLLPFGFQLKIITFFGQSRLVVGVRSHWYPPESQALGVLEKLHFFLSWLSETDPRHPSRWPKKSMRSCKYSSTYSYFKASVANHRKSMSLFSRLVNV